MPANTNWAIDMNMDARKPKASCIAFLGTGSDVGKSIVTTAFCRVLARKGIRVAPYKAQNMSNNSGVTPEGLEMGRAQIVQAEACGIAPHVDMNPILLKPTSDVGSQVVLLGKAVANKNAADYHREKKVLFQLAKDALDRLRSTYDAVVMEGAGSCAEVNLMENDLVNLPMAEAADAGVVLVADIHRGGVFAQIVGTLACIKKKHRERIKGAVINRFRGDKTLFEDGVRWIEKKTEKPVFGVLPWYTHFHIEAEDSVVIEQPELSAQSISDAQVAVIRLPHIANFTDFEALVKLPNLKVAYLEKPRSLEGLKVVILPGSKNTRHDLEWLHKTGWTREIKAFHETGGQVHGICGGYQMLGGLVADPQGIEGDPGNTAGIGLLPAQTVLTAPKTTTLTHFKWDGAAGYGYEIHMGKTIPDAQASPLLDVITRNQVVANDTDGLITFDKRVLGTYVHGLFDTPAVLRTWLKQVGLGQLPVPEDHGAGGKEKAYELLADHFEAHIDTEKIIQHLGL